MIQAHADAILALLRAAPGSPALVVHDGIVPAGQTTPPYVLVYLHAGYPPDSGVRSLTMATAELALTITLHCVGGNAVAARAVANRARTALLDVVPTVTGRVCWPVRHLESQPPRRDESTGTAVMDQVDVYQLRSVPA